MEKRQTLNYPGRKKKNTLELGPQLMSYIWLNVKLGTIQAQLKKAMKENKEALFLAWEQ